ncbi:hypothetical protein [Arthrobacter sp.]|nr:hypothetical protein [Arthrobacter sp.]MDO5751940.1 hypothetical protein [Arthrobacter sp.]
MERVKLEQRLTQAWPKNMTISTTAQLADAGLGARSLALAL